MPEFRTALTDEGVGIYDEFLITYEADVAKFSSSTQYEPKPDRPSNSFNISMIPWLTFTSFNINVFSDGKYLLPIFTLGKYFEDNEKRLIPLSIQVPHAVCDGYHVGKFVETLQKLINHF